MKVPGLLSVNLIRRSVRLDSRLVELKSTSKPHPMASRWWKTKKGRGYLIQWKIMILNKTGLFKGRIPTRSSWDF